jgi:hypothetical protein
LQVDLAFVERWEFRPLGPKFRMVWGEAGKPATIQEPEARELAGMAWLHAIHARSSLLRGRLWQAEYMIRAVRDLCLALACLRWGLETAHGRGMDGLPEAVKAELAGSLTGGLEPDALWAAFAVCLRALVVEIGYADPELAERAGEEILALASR